MSDTDALRKELQALRNDLATYQRDAAVRLNRIAARDAWQVSEEDNVDASNGLLIDIYIPPNGVTRHIQQVILRIKLKAFRSYSAVTEAGGETTVTSAAGGGTTATSSAGGGTTVTSASGGSTTPTSGGGVWYTEGGYTSGFDATDTTGSHDHGATVSADGDHAHVITLNHNHTVTIPSHTHDVTIPNHTHDVTLLDHTHDVEIPAHTHPITAAITTGTTASDCTILINGTDRTNALVGAASFNTDQDELDVTEYMTATGYNTIEITSATLGRIRCTAFVNLYLNNR